MLARVAALKAGAAAAAAETAALEAEAEAEEVEAEIAALKGGVQVAADETAALAEEATALEKEERDDAEDAKSLHVGDLSAGVDLQVGFGLLLQSVRVSPDSHLHPTRLTSWLPAVLCEPISARIPVHPLSPPTHNPNTSLEPRGIAHASTTLWLKASPNLGPSR